jgi:CMP-N-acetylneuraminic acid synthetase
VSGLSRGVLGLIPAKAGSTRFVRKNVALLRGKPLIGWAADAAREAGVIDRLILSTEDEEVAAAARAIGIEVPFLRPASLARDPAGVVDVALHALDALETGGARYEALVILLPTCPLRTSADIRAAFNLFRSRDEGSLMSVTEFDHTPFAALRLGEDGLVAPHFPDYFGRKSQQMPPAYRPNGAIHVLDVARFRKSRSYIAPPVIAYVMPRERSIDIDTALDLRFAETLLAMAAGTG